MGSSGGGGSNPPVYQLNNMGGADNSAQQGITALQNDTGLQQLFNQGQNSLGGIASQPSGYSPQDVVQSGYNVQGAAGMLPGLGQNVNSAAQGLPFMAQQIYQTGFDPQNALFGQLQQQVADQTGALEAQQGMSGSPYAAGLAGQNLANLDVSWQNNLLNRETQAGQSANTLLQGFGGLEGDAANIAQTYGQLMGQGASIMAQGPEMQMSALDSLAGLKQSVLAQNQQGVSDWLQYLATGNQSEGVALQSQQIGNQAAQAAGQQNMQAAGMGASMLGGMGGK